MAEVKDSAGAGIPAQEELPDPTGGVYSPSGKITDARQVSAIPYGSASQFLGTERKDLNPIKSPPAQEIIKAARKKINEHLRALKQPPYNEDEDIPWLLVLIELTQFTKDPLKTLAYRALANVQVELCTSRPMRTQWQRTPYEAVPYEVRQFPLHVADMLLSQIKSFILVPERRTIGDGAAEIWVGKKLRPEQLVKIAWRKFRDRTKAEIEAKEKLDRPYNQQHITRIQDNTGGGSLQLDLNPGQGQDEVVDAGAHSVPTEDGRARTFAPAPADDPQPGAPAPAQGETGVPQAQAASPSDHPAKPGDSGVPSGQVGEAPARNAPPPVPSPDSPRGSTSMEPPQPEVPVPSPEEGGTGIPEEEGTEPAAGAR